MDERDANQAGHFVFAIILTLLAVGMFLCLYAWLRSGNPAWGAVALFPGVFFVTWMTPYLRRRR